MKAWQHVLWERSGVTPGQRTFQVSLVMANKLARATGVRQKISGHKMVRGTWVYSVIPDYDVTP